MTAHDQVHRFCFYAARLESFSCDLPKDLKSHIYWLFENECNQLHKDGIE